MSVFSVGRVARQLSILAASLLVLFPAFQAICGAGESAADKALSARLWADYLETVKGVQAVKVAAWYTKDAVIILPDSAELRGRDAIQAYLLKAYQGLKIQELKFTPDRVEVIGGRAYTFGVVDEAIQEGAAPPTRLKARCAAVWEQQSDQSWQIAYFLVNFLAP